MADRPSQDSRLLSHGRGGAGNLAKSDPTTGQPAAEDLVTPTLKLNTYTTGRGGTGNMAANDPQRPEVARAAQDVDAPNVQSKPVHYGRGGAANVIEKDEKRKSGEARRKSSEPQRKSEDVKREEGAAKSGLLAKGKEFLNKMGKK
ncbi:hypothetical protein EK21DRAFT_108590 [Setomelanomma holmii]|uniref:Uncharacterized protein n=1 Tax=Setomelanomma holmii TaxID=210430 RepID=A0A9P4HIU9_9PLEO|nr:hypothetical protein EK21DRAFT_108590 [Setomelanomma holmii]